MELVVEGLVRWELVACRLPGQSHWLRRIHAMRGQVMHPSGTILCNRASVRGIGALQQLYRSGEQAIGRDRPFEQPLDPVVHDFHG